MTADPSDVSRAIRERISAQRRALGPERLAKLSRQIVQRFFSLSGLGPDRFKGLRVALYQALPTELSLHKLEEVLAGRGTRFFFPRIADDSSKELEFVEIGPDRLLGVLKAERAHRAWRQGPYGIQEPHSSLPAHPSDQFDLIFVPGVAFGLSGERIGMGAGYYDRFLARVLGPIRVVLAFDFQLQDRLEQNPWDQPVDWIVTEKREVRRPRAEAWLQARLAQLEG